MFGVASLLFSIYLRKLEMGLLKVFEKSRPIDIIDKDRLLLVSTRCDVIKSAGEFDPELSSHRFANLSLRIAIELDDKANNNSHSSWN